MLKLAFPSNSKGEHLKETLSNFGILVNNLCLNFARIWKWHGNELSKFLQANITNEPT